MYYSFGSSLVVTSLRGPFPSYGQTFRSNPRVVYPLPSVLENHLKNKSQSPVSPSTKLLKHSSVSSFRYSSVSPFDARMCHSFDTRLYLLLMLVCVIL